MALAIHAGGPADGAKVSIEQLTQVRHYAPASARSVVGWVSLDRYVFVPPRVGKRCQYRHTGTNQVQGPVPGDKAAPDWS